MTNFLELCTKSFAVIVLVSFCGAVVMNFLALNPKASPEKRDFYEDCMFRFGLCCQYSLLFAAGFAVLLLTAHCFEVIEFL